MRRWSVILSALVVLAAVAVMIRLGFWQLDRLHAKESLLARYEAAETMSAEVPFPGNPREASRVLYRRSRLACQTVIDTTTMAGEDIHGEGGQAHVAICRLASGASAKVVLGWSRDPTPPVWRGGEVTGTIAPGPRLVADPPLAGLAANARPDPANLPNNHLSYAIQWFLFAGVALVIYALALRKRLAVKGARR